MPTFSRLKDLVEKRTGLALGDALNLSLFVLTLVSLVFAAAGLAIAIIAYVDAEKSGKAQETQLEKSANSLTSATSTLDASKIELRAINESLDKSIGIAKRQQENLDASLKLSSAQLDALHTQNEIASRAPRVMVAVSCAPNVFEAIDNEKPAFLRPIEASKHIPSIAVRLKDDSELVCLIQLVNQGKAKLTRAYLKAEAEAEVDANDDWAFSGQQGHPQYAVFPNADEAEVVKRDWRDQTYSKIELLKEVTVFPTINTRESIESKVHPQASVWLVLKIPSYAEHVSMSFWYGGDDQVEVKAEADLPIIRKS
jgi:hypothetical protein